MAFTLQGYDVAGRTQPTQGNDAGKSFLDAMTQIKQVSLARREEERKAAEHAIIVEKNKRENDSLFEQNEAFKEVSMFNKALGKNPEPSELTSQASQYLANQGNLPGSLALHSKAEKMRTDELANKTSLGKLEQAQRDSMLKDFDSIVNMALNDKGEIDPKRAKEAIKEAIPDLKERYSEKTTKILEQNIDKMGFFGSIVTTKIPQTNNIYVRDTRTGTGIVLNNKEFSELLAEKKGGAGGSTEKHKDAIAALKARRDMIIAEIPQYKHMAEKRRENPKYESKFKEIDKITERLDALSASQFEDLGISWGKDSAGGKTDKSLDESMAKSILQEAGGDKVKARELAKKRGYNISE